MSLWVGTHTKHSPALAFLVPNQTVELSPADADRLSVRPGEPVRVGANGTRVNAIVVVRAGIPDGTAYLIDGAEDGPANALLNGETVEVTSA